MTATTRTSLIGLGMEMRCSPRTADPGPDAQTSLAASLKRTLIQLPRFRRLPAGAHCSQLATGTSLRTLRPS